MARQWLIGIEIGGTKLQLGLGRPDGSLVGLERHRIDPAQGAQGILDTIVIAFRTILDREGIAADEVAAVGIGFGGPVDVENGRTQTSFQVQGWTDFPLADWVRSTLGVPAVAIQNDADTAGLAEAIRGAGVGYSPVLYLTIGSGIGGAIILDGRIYRGAGRGAGEIGHLEVLDALRPSAPPVELESIASGWGIRRLAREEAEDDVASGAQPCWIVLERAGGDVAAITTEMVAEAAIMGDERSIAILERARRALAFALRQAIALIGPARIILGGGVSLIGEALWFDPLRRLVDAEVFPPFRGSYEIVPAALGEEVVVHGAIALARDAALALRKP